MSNIIQTINRISKKIKNSSGYNYLYEYCADFLVRFLDDKPHQEG